MIFFLDIIIMRCQKQLSKSKGWIRQHGDCVYVKISTYFTGLCVSIIKSLCFDAIFLVPETTPEKCM